MPPSRNSRLSLWSTDSVLCIGSRGSVLSIGSVASACSIGSIGQQTSLAREATRFWSGAWLANVKPKAKQKPKRRR